MIARRKEGKNIGEEKLGGEDKKECPQHYIDYLPLVEFLTTTS